jgi:hypothetical protein
MESERKRKNLRTQYREPCRLLRTCGVIRLTGSLIGVVNEAICFGVDVLNEFYCIVCSPKFQNFTKKEILPIKFRNKYLE